MSGVYIPGMEMPTACMCCPCEYDNVCTVLHKYPEEWEWNTSRPEWCPLVPVPDHGDLIDRDNLLQLCKEMQGIEWNNKAAPYSWAYAYESFESDVDDAPTIIPGEEEEE